MTAYTILGLFIKSTDAKIAMADLKSRGFLPHNLSPAIRRNKPGPKELNELFSENNTTIRRSAITGVILGTVTGFLLGLGSITIPSFSALFIGGPFISGVESTAAGALAGGLIATLIALGLPQEEALWYEDTIKAGGTLLAIATSKSHTENVEEILRKDHAEDVIAMSQKHQQRKPTEQFLPAMSTLLPIPLFSPYYAYAGIKGGVSKKKSIKRRSPSRKTSSHKASAKHSFH